MLLDSDVYYNHVLHKVNLQMTFASSQIENDRLPTMNLAKASMKGILVNFRC